MNKTLSWHVYAVTTIILWAGAYVFTKVALIHFSPLPLGFLRCLVASAALLTIMVLKREPFPPVREMPRFILSGALGFSLYLALFNHGSGFLTAATSCLIISTAPILTAFGAARLFGERLPGGAWGAMALEFAGLAILTLWNGVLAVNQGVVWMLGAAALISGYNLIQRLYCRWYSALQITTLSFCAGTIMLGWWLPQAAGEAVHAPWGQIIVVLFLGIGPSALAYLAWAQALALADRAGAVANYMFLTPFLSLVLGYLVITEIPDAGTFIGGAVILAGLGLFNFKVRRGAQK